MSNKNFMEINKNIQNYNIISLKQTIYEKLHKTHNVIVLKQVKKILETNEKNHL